MIRFLKSLTPDSLFHRAVLFITLSFFTASIGLWVASVYSPRALHWNRGPDLGESISLIPHRILIAVVEFPPDPDSQALSSARPPGVYTEKLDRHDYDDTFDWLSLGFQRTSGPYPVVAWWHPGAWFAFRLRHRAWVIPLWIFPVLFGAIPNFYLLQSLRSGRRQNRNLCRKCSYDLRAHRPGDKCPECGTLWNPRRKLRPNP